MPIDASTLIRRELNLLFVGVIVRYNRRKSAVFGKQTTVS